MATRALLQQVLRTGSPIIACVRRDATADQVRDICLRVENLIQDAGLALERAAHAPHPWRLGQPLLILPGVTR